jgi:hypothetical protein
MRSFDSFLMFFASASAVVGGFVLIFQFLSLRMRNTALPAEERDPHTGRKFALGVFFHLGVLLVLTGLTLSAVDICENLTGSGNSGGNAPATWRAGPGMPPPPPAAGKPFFNTQQRTACGLMLSGVLHGVLFFMLLTFATNARKFPAVGRAFVINRLLIAGVILMAITTSFCVMLFAEGEFMVESFGRVLGLALVWGPAALGHFLWLMFGMSKEKAKAKQKVDDAPPAREREREREEPRRSRRDDDEDRDEPRRRRRED